MNQKGISKIVIVGIIVAILAVSAIAAYWATSGGADDSGNNNGGTIDNGSEDDGGTTVDVAGASSLQYKVSVNPADAESVEYTYMIKNAETSDMMMRIEMESSGESFIYIINGVQQKVWVCSGDQWMDFSDVYSTYWDTWNSAWEGYRTNLLDWTGVGDWTYTTPNGDSVRIYDIDINPSLADSLFQH
ncbi:hypothetical protein ES703_88290 [subsurface metagenome]